MDSRLVSFSLGMISMGMAVASVFFLRFYRDSHDRLFLFFAAAFGCEAFNRAILAFTADPREADPLHYIIRALAYSLILIGILDKNRSAG